MNEGHGFSRATALVLMRALAPEGSQLYRIEADWMRADCARTSMFMRSHGPQAPKVMKKAFGPATTLQESVALSFVIPPAPPPACRGSS